MAETETAVLVAPPSQESKGQEEVEQKLRKIGTNQIGWKYTKLILDPKTVQKFDFLLNRREIRQGNVRKLRALLARGEHFETPLVCNLVKNKYRLIDGNHRVEAIKQFLELYPERRVEVGVCYYENINAEEEKDIFTKWNMGTKQNISDFLKQYWHDIPITKILEKPGVGVPITAYSNANTLEFRHLVGCYLSRNVNSNFHYRGSAIDFIKDSQELGHSDVNVMREFLRDYIDVFGTPDKMNSMYKPIIYGSIFKIWWKNKSQFGPAQMRQRWAILKGHGVVLNWSKMGYSGQNTTQCHVDILRALNGSRHTKLFI